MIYAQAGTTFRAILSGAPTGLTGTLGARITDPSTTTTLAARTTAGIVEYPAGSGIYSVDLVAPTAAAIGRALPATLEVVWDNAGVYSAEELVVSVAPNPAALPPTAEPYYTTTAAVRTEVGVDAATLPDAAALKLIIDAEERVDNLVGPTGINIDTGRRLTPSTLQPFQVAKLDRATVILAAALYRNPHAFDPAVSGAVKGPDFETLLGKVGLIPADGQIALRHAAQRLDEGRLRRLFARLRAG